MRLFKRLPRRRRCLLGGDRWTERGTERQRDRGTERQRDREIAAHRDRGTEREIGTRGQRERDRERGTEKQRDRERERDRWTAREGQRVRDRGTEGQRERDRGGWARCTPALPHPRRRTRVPQRQPHTPPPARSRIVLDRQVSERVREGVRDRESEGGSERQGE